MPNLTTKLDLTSTTIQIRSDDAKSNFMNFDHDWEAVACILVTASVSKTDSFDEEFKKLPSYQREYLTLVCNNTVFDKEKRYYIPDWVFLEVEGETMKESIENVVIELVTGVKPRVMPNLFTANVTGIEMDIDAEIGFPVLD